MKKILSLAIMALGSITVTLAADAPMRAPSGYTTVCGITVGTVDKDFFENEKEWISYCAELDMFYCGYTDKGSGGQQPPGPNPDPTPPPSPAN